jgi:lysophospholipase L1-like esterase
MRRRKIMLIIIVVIVAVILFIGANLAIVKYNGSPVAVPTIPRSVQTAGSGEPRSYVILGDSTAVGQGAAYEDTYAYASTQYVARTHRVSVQNVAISGARAQSVIDKQLESIVIAKPDIALLAVGANDVTHFTSSKAFEASLETIITKLRAKNPDVKIIVTGVPDMRSVPRFPWPIKQLAGHRTNQFNAIYDRIAAKHSLIFAPIAEKTGKTFRENPQLFAADKFHPNADGYAQWTPVINDALNKALRP